jgi:ammonium transporter, Amt family
VNAGDTAWVLGSAALVMFMTPGLALFYGVIWVAFGYSVAFGQDQSGGLIGDLAQSGLHGLPTALTGVAGHRIPVFAVASFQLMFAVITVALLAGAVAERTRFWPWLVFVAAWVTIVYLPLAHWVFDPNGWMVSRLHLLDFAGGTAVEVNSGAASLALAAVLGKRLGWPTTVASAGT